MRLEQGKKYVAELALPFFVPVSVAVSQLRQFGFRGVSSLRLASGVVEVRGTWDRPSAVVDLPPQIKRPRVEL